MRFTCFVSTLLVGILSQQSSAVHVASHQLSQLEAIDHGYAPLELLQLENEAIPVKKRLSEEKKMEEERMERIRKERIRKEMALKKKYEEENAARLKWLKSQKLKKEKEMLERERKMQNEKDKDEEEDEDEEKEEEKKEEPAPKALKCPEDMVMTPGKPGHCHGKCEMGFEQDDVDPTVCHMQSIEVVRMK